MHFRRFGVAEGVNMPGSSCIRASLGGIKAREQWVRPTGSTRSAATCEIVGEMAPATGSTERHGSWRTLPRSRGVPVFQALPIVPIAKSGETAHLCN
jgi:hypothetical protein